MVFRFSPGEILTMATELERRGIAFYEGLEKKSPKEEGKRIFRFLADEERRHLEVFSRLLEDTQDTLLDESGEVSQYLGTVVESGVLRKVLQGEIASEALGVFEALDIGIQVEKESILFYQGFFPFIAPEKANWLEEVIAEEKRHFIQLHTLKEEMMKRGDR